MSCLSQNFETFSINSDIPPGATKVYTHPDGGVTLFTLTAHGKTADKLTTSVSDKISFSIFSRAYAQPGPCIVRFNQKITALEVRSSVDFDMNHPAGTVLNDLIEIEQGDLRSNQGRFWLLDKSLPISPEFSYQYYLRFKFNKANINPAIHHFTVDIHTTDYEGHEQAFSVESDAIDLTMLN